MIFTAGQLQKTLRQMLQKTINQKNMDGKAPLDIDIDYMEITNENVVKGLLSLGAHVGMDKVPYKVMEAFLNERMTMESEIHPINSIFLIGFDEGTQVPLKIPFGTMKSIQELHAGPDNEPTIYFDYSFLFLNSSEDYCTIHAKNDWDNIIYFAAGPEMLWLSGMEQSKTNRKLLSQHPVLMSFLHFKWNMVQRYFNLKLALYLHFTYLITWFVFTEFAVHKDDEGSSDYVWNIAYGILTFATAAFMLVGSHINLDTLLSDWKVSCNGKLLKDMIPSLAEMIVISGSVAVTVLGRQSLEDAIIFLFFVHFLMEVFQIIVTRSQYFQSFENFMEILIFAFLGLIMLNEDIEKDIKGTISAYLLVLTWAEMLVRTGKHPRFAFLSLSITMFVTVIMSYGFFMLWYLILIVSFAFGFHIIMFKDADLSTNNTQLFQDPFLSVVKTTAMMIGELDVSDLDLPEGNWKQTLSFIFLLSFVFIVVIVLTNLMNALAVRDIGDKLSIESSAQISSYASRIRTLLFIESAQCPKWFKRKNMVRDYWYWLTNVKGTRIANKPEKFPILSLKIRDGTHHFSDKTYKLFRKNPL
jgi:hypothetical protein